MSCVCVRSGVEADLEDENKAVDTSIADSIAWTPSARGEPGKTPRDLAFGPLKDYCADLYQVNRRKYDFCPSPPAASTRSRARLHLSRILIYC